MLSPLWKFELHVSSPCITATFPSLVQKGDIDKDVQTPIPVLSAGGFSTIQRFSMFSTYEQAR